MKDILSEEGQQIEFKKAENKLPKSFWDTYSSFSNTIGGYVFLGINEGEKELEVTGVSDSVKILKDLVTLSNDPEYTNLNNISDENIEIYEVDDKKVIQIYIPEVDKSQKPVYIKGNINNSYIRRNDSDQKMKPDEIRRYLRDADPKGDAQLLNHYKLEDLDLDTVRNYKLLLQDREKDIDITSLKDWEFLKKYGALGKDSEGEYRLKKGALLFFGKEESIVNVFPSFHLDYINRVGGTLEKRWIDRVSSGDLNTKEMNLFNFYNIVLDKMVNTVMEDFQIDETTQRRETTKRDVEVAIREGLANALIHADYEDNTSVKIEAFNNHYVFINPGEMLVTPEEFARGGESRTRNNTIVTLFRRAGYSERAGSGGMKIFQVAVQNKFRIPEVQSREGKTKMTIWKTDLVDSYPDLSEKEYTVLKYIQKNGRVSMKDLHKIEEMTEYYAKESVNSLIDKSIIKKFGRGRSTKYGFETGSREMIATLENNLRTIQDMIVRDSKK